MIELISVSREAECGCGGMADAQDSKSCGGDPVWVQVPPSAAYGAKLNCSGSIFAPFCVFYGAKVNHRFKFRIVFLRIKRRTLGRVLYYEPFLY